MPDAFATPDVVPNVVAGLAAAINFVRQFIVDNDLPIFQRRVA